LEQERALPLLVCLAALIYSATVRVCVNNRAMNQQAGCEKNIAHRMERSRMAIVAKQEEFCCGPRQGN